jgi:xanthine dehydrogenase YagS FAD-binding subunit
VITAVELPPEGFHAHYTYLKLRDRLSFAFALVSVAVALRIENDTIVDARIALGGVSHKPWRDASAEKVLRGKRPDTKLFTRVASRLVSKARGYAHNKFKIELARRAINRALTQAAAATPQSQTDKRVR